MKPSPHRLIAIASAAFLALGSALYICLRHDSLLMFRWAEATGLGEGVRTVREATRGMAEAIPGWATYSLPYALWVISYMLAIEWIWRETRSTAKLMWMAVAPAIAIASEIAQAARLIPGTFDWADLALLIGASIVGAAIAIACGSLSNNERKSEEPLLSGSSDPVHGASRRQRRDRFGRK